MQVKAARDELRYGRGMLTETIQHFYNEDREHLDQLLREFERAATEDLELAARIFAEFRENLEQHIRCEEEILYPVFQRVAGARECGMESMRGEHAAIRAQVELVERLLDRADGRLVVEQITLRDLLNPHCAKEELVFYPLLDEMLTRSEREEILEQMQARAVARLEAQGAVAVE